MREYDRDEVNTNMDELTEIAIKIDVMETVGKMKDIVSWYKSNNIYEELDR